MYTAYTFIGAASDLFLSIMMWFIFYTEKTPTVVVDGDKFYTVLNVIKQDNSVIINEHCDDEQEQDDFDPN
jgi:hypothetical protein